MDCDGVRRTFIEDLDGSLMGTQSQPSAMITESDYGWNKQPARGLNDDNIPYTYKVTAKERNRDLYNYTGLNRFCLKECSQQYF